MTGPQDWAPGAQPPNPNSIQDLWKSYLHVRLLDHQLLLLPIGLSYYWYHACYLQVLYIFGPLEFPTWMGHNWDTCMATATSPSGCFEVQVVVGASHAHDSTAGGISVSGSCSRMDLFWTLWCDMPEKKKKKHSWKIPHIICHMVRQTRSVLPRDNLSGILP